MKDKFANHKRIKGTFGVWNSASNTLPCKNGRYLVILETKSPVERCQSWSGIGEPEINIFNEDWHFKWSGRGTLSVAYWTALPEFNKEWVKNKNKPGKWVDSDTNLLI